MKGQMPAARLFAAFLFFLSALPLGAQPAALPETVVGPSGAVAWWDCTLNPLPESSQGRLLLLTIGAKVHRGVLPWLGMANVDVSGLTLADGRIKGQVIVGHVPIRQNHSICALAARLPLDVDLAVQNGRVTGSFIGKWPVGRAAAPGNIKGRVTGTVLDESALRKAYALPAGAAWPCYLGPNQNFSSGPSSRPIVEDLCNARLLWASQYIGPCESGSKRYGACVGTPPSAGGASPLVANGKVYQFRYQATGDVYQTHLDEQLAGDRAEEVKQKMAAVGWTMAEMKQRWAIDADEQLVALDAATGQTLWSVTWPGEGVNLYDHKCSLTNHTGVVADGRAYVFGTLGIVRCVDAESGKVLWSANVPGYHDLMSKFKATALQHRDISPPTRSFCHALSLSGKTLVAPDSNGACGLVGLDAVSGKLLWRVKERVLGASATPLAWRKGEKDYIVAANAEGQITLISAAEGQIVWQYKDAGANRTCVILVGDLLVAHKAKLTKDEHTEVKAEEDAGAVFSAPGRNRGQVGCWRLTTQGPEQLWFAPKEWGAPGDTPIGAAIDGLVCFRGLYSYYLVKADTGERVARTHLTSPARFDEGHLLALPGTFVLHPDTQHGQDKFYPYPAKPGGKCGPVWMPPHPHATTYEIGMSHAWVDGRLFIRGADAIYCYDLRQTPEK